MRLLFHVTAPENVETILKYGLTPRIGGYAKQMGETTPSIWCFPCLEDAYEMTPVWLEPYYGEGLSILEIRLPDDFPVKYTGSDYEVVSTERIPPEYISVYAA